VSLYAKNFVNNSISGELMDTVTQVKIPVYFFTGRYDYTDPFRLTEQYFTRIEAPEKHLVWFEDSAHFPFYEEPAAFARRMREVLNGPSRGQSHGVGHYSPPESLQRLLARQSRHQQLEEAVWFDSNCNPGIRME
jgi:hypothetical protein